MIFVLRVKQNNNNMINTLALTTYNYSKPSTLASALRMTNISRMCVYIARLSDCMCVRTIMHCYTDGAA